MRMGIVALLVCVAIVQAERPPQFRDKADAAITGTVVKLESTNDKFGGDGVMTRYTAKIKVTAVTKGEDLKVGDEVTVRWFHVTKRPGRPGFVGAFGQDHGLKEKDEARFWLMKGKDGMTVIYNKDGVEKVKAK